MARCDSLRSLGIEKGKPFNPDPQTKAALDAGAREAKAWLEAKYDAGLPPFYPGSRWTVPALPELLAAVQANFDDPDKYPVDAHGLTYPFRLRRGVVEGAQSVMFLVSDHTGASDEHLLRTP